MTGTQEFMVGATRLRLAAGTLALESLAVAGQTWFAGGPLWTLLTVDETGHRVTLDGSHAALAEARSEGDGVRLAWSGVADAAGAGPFDVEVTIRPGAEAGVTRWRIAVSNRSGWTLWSVAFPRLGGLVPAGDGAADRLFYPEGWGTELTGWETFPELRRRYPRGWDMALQLLGYTRGATTFSLAVHDPALTTKDFHFTKHEDRAGRSAGFAVVGYPEDMSRPGNSYRPAYDAVVTVQPGDWYDAATAYAAWARRQEWASPDLSRGRAPGVQAWQVVNVPSRGLDEWAERTERLAARLGVRLGVHFYDWHETPFDTNYPDYFPARPGFAGLVARLRRTGALTMPYINARLWDTNAPSWAGRGAERWAAKGSAQRLRPASLFTYLEEYETGQKLAPMCPTTDAWQATVVDLCQRIVHELGSDGVYLDQLTAERAELCFDPGHGHPLGGGGFWWAGYRQLLDRIRAAVPEAYLTSECNWEAGVGALDGLLTWQSVPGHLIPLFPAVYSGLARTFGCRFDAADLSEDGGVRFATRMAQLLCWGAELGWGDLTRLLDDPAREPLLDYFTALCRARARLEPLFRTGRLLRPPTVEGGPGVLAALWADPAGATTLLVVNPTLTSRQVTLTAGAETLTVSLEALSHQVVALGDPPPAIHPPVKGDHP
jgi:hypothetical protein